MFKKILWSVLVLIIFDVCVRGCLITNCPRGGKRGGNFGLTDNNNVKLCTSCGPGYSGQCFGPSICCGPFGCLIGTSETLRCKQEGFFQEREPCLVSGMPCRKNTGKCATENICCTQDSCFIDKECENNEKIKSISDISGLNLYNFMGKYHEDLPVEK